MSRAVVVGAGLAGLSAAVRLLDTGYQVQVLERRREAGGRIRRIRPTPRHPGVDFGQHLMLGCYLESFSLARRLGTAHLLTPVKESTPFLSGPDRVHPYRVGRLPAPLHLLPGLTGLTHLGRLERLGLGLVFAGAKAALALSPERLDETDARSWLKSLGQSENAVEGFWDPLITATLNTGAESASAYLLAAVLDKGFLAHRSDAEPVLPTTTLHDVFVKPIRALLEECGGAVRRDCEAVRFTADGRGSVRAVETAGGDTVAADVFVAAVPSWRIASLTRGLPELDGLEERAAALSFAPIVNVDLWYENKWLRYPYAGLLGSPVQWVFDHGFESNAPGGGSGFRVSVVISNAREALHDRKARLVETAAREIERYFPEACRASLTGGLVTKARRATFVGRPGQRSLRPGSATPYRNLFLAGDWTATGLPATIEGAVTSGVQAARAAVAREKG